MDISTCVLDELDDAVCAIRVADRSLLARNAKFVEWFGAAAEGELPEALRGHVEPILAALREPAAPHDALAKPIAMQVKPANKRAIPAELSIRQSAEPGIVAVTVKSVAKLAEKESMLKSFTTIVDQNNRTLKRQRQAVSELLDNMRQAVFVFDSRGIVQEPVSGYTRTVFGRNIAGASIYESVFAGIDPESEALAIVKSTLAFAFGEGELQWSVNADKLPERFECEVDGAPTRRRLRAAYTPLWDEEANLDRVMMVVEDVTELEELEIALAAERAASARRLKIIDEVIDQDATRLGELYGSFERNLRSVDEAFDSAFAGVSVASESIGRTLHTIKGNARTLGLRLLAETAHRSEDRFLHCKASGDASGFREALGELGSCLEAYRVISARILPPDAGREPRGTIAVERTLFGELEAALRTRLGADDSVIALFERLTHVNLVRLKGELDSIARDVGAQLRKDVRVDLVDAGVTVSPETYERVHDCLVHLVRNAVDHGVETAEDREASGKAASATITVTCALVEEGVLVVVEDDGAGIDSTRVLETAIARGLISREEASGADEQRVFDFLLVPGFTTKSIVSDVSGRGVGLDAVSAAVRERGGSLRIASEHGRGTRFSLVFPQSHELDRGTALAAE